MTKGYKTTEFWLSLAAILIGAVMASGALEGLGGDHWLVKVIGICSSVLGALGYTAIRGLTKVGEMKLEATKVVAANPPSPPQP